MTTDKVGKKIAISILWDTVSIEVICGDEYEAALG